MLEEKSSLTSSVRTGYGAILRSLSEREPPASSYLFSLAWNYLTHLVINCLQ